VNNTNTVDLHISTDSPNYSLPQFSHEEYSKLSHAFPRLSQIAGLVITLLSAPATAIPDIWFWDRRRANTISTVWLMQEIIGRPVSRKEALAIACEILARAERKRIENAELEAARGLQWDN
jgi:hypothetical protein